MARYPIKQLQDKNRVPFFPFNTLESVLVDGTNKNLADILNDIYTKEEINAIISQGLSEFDIYNSPSELPEEAREGHVAVVITGTSYIMYVFYEDAWHTLTQKGDKGDPGATGAQGPQGPQGPAGQNGTDGEDGFSPIANVTKSGSVATITITDKTGTTTANVYDGTSGGGTWGSITGDLEDQADLSNALGNKQDIMQYSIMPTASATYEDKIVQYIGTTTSTYTNGYFYKCVFSENTYKWEQLDVQPSSGSVSNIAHLYYYLGILPTTTVTSGHFFDTVEKILNDYLQTGSPCLLYTDACGIFYLFDNGEYEISLINKTDVDSKVHNLTQDRTSIEKMSREYLMNIDPTTEALDSVSLISGASRVITSVLATGVDYATPYTPQYDGSPATKKYVDDSVATKQDTLISGTSIKTINGTSLLGSGDITISGGTVDSSCSTTSTNAIQNKAITTYVNNRLGGAINAGLNVFVKTPNSSNTITLSYTGSLQNTALLIFGVNILSLITVNSGVASVLNLVTTNTLSAVCDNTTHKLTISGFAERKSTTIFAIGKYTV